MNAVIVFGGYALIILAAAAQMWILINQNSAALTRAEAGFERERTTLTDIIIAEQAGRATAQERFTEILNKMSEDHANELRQTMNLKSFGVPEAGDAVVIPSKPDAEQRATRQIREQTIETGTLRIMDNYERIGLHVTREKAREEAIALLSGGFPST